MTTGQIQASGDGAVAEAGRGLSAGLFSDLRQSLSSPSTWIYPAWLAFRAPYRKSVLGTVWPILSPLAFVAILGTLFSVVMGRPAEEFIPSLAIGLIVWNYINSLFMSSVEYFFANSQIIMQGHVVHATLMLRSITKASFYLLLQSSIIAGVLIYFGVVPTAVFPLFLVGLALLFAHSLWVMVVLGILTARYHDLKQLIPIVMRVGFLATPIIWMPHSERGEFLAPFLLLNPFYHVLEPIRAPLLGQLPDFASYWISLVMALLGLAAAAQCYRLFQHRAILWV
jgi:ABC-type polysaccharide/polyol phosphate export permease